MLSRVAVGLRPSVRDVVGQRVAGKIGNELNLPVNAVRIVKIFTIDGLSQAEIQAVIDAGVLNDPVVQTASAAPLTPAPETTDWIIEVGFRPGVTDNEARTARDAILLALELPEARRKDLAVYTAVQYHIEGLSRRADAEHVALDLLGNDLLQRHDVKSREEWLAEPGFPARTAKVTGQASSKVEVPDLFNMLEDQMLELGRQRTLALSLEEWWAIRAYFGQPGFKMRRSVWGLIHNLTDVELECLAQTWSEHCKHKIFNARHHLPRRRDRDRRGHRQPVQDLHPGPPRPTSAAPRASDDFCLSVCSRTTRASSASPRTCTCASRWRPTTARRRWTPTAGRSRASWASTATPWARAWGPTSCATPTCSVSPRRFSTANCRRACCTRAGCSRACARAWSTAATRAASPRSTAPSSSTSATWASRWSTAAPSAPCRRPRWPASRATSKRPAPGDVHRHGRRPHRQGRHPRRDLLVRGTARGFARPRRCRSATPSPSGKHVRLPHARPRPGPVQRHHRQRRGRPVQSRGRDGPGLRRLRTLDLDRVPAQVRRPRSLGDPHLRGPGAHDPGRAAGKARRNSWPCPGKWTWSPRRTRHLHQLRLYLHVRLLRPAAPWPSIDMDFLHEGTAPVMKLAAAWERPVIARTEPVLPAGRDHGALLRRMLVAAEHLQQGIRGPPVRPRGARAKARPSSPCAGCKPRRPGRRRRAPAGPVPSPRAWPCPTASAPAIPTSTPTG